MEKMELLSSTAQTLVDQLVKQFDQGQLAQAYVFYGSNLSGHRMAAHILAEKVLTHGPQMPGGFPAEVTVKFVANETHPNFFVLKPEEDKTEITVEGARSLNTFLQSTATLSGWRVALIEPADRLNTAASNALLKSLEELPFKVTVVLIAESLHSIKQTILSRTQKVFFSQTGSETETLLASSPWAKKFLGEVERLSQTGRLPSKEDIEALKEPSRQAAVPGLLQHFVAKRVYETLGNAQIARIWLDKYAALSRFIVESRDRSLADTAVLRAMLILAVQ